MNVRYRQCIMTKSSGQSILQVTSWIPEQFAKIGKYLKLKDDDGWKVISVGSVVYDEQTVNERSQDYKKTRLASDI